MLIKSNGYEISSSMNRAVSERKLYIFIGLAMLFIVAAVALSAATLATVLDRLETKYVENFDSNSLVDRITSEELMKHLTQLQRIADQGSGTRAIATAGFNGTLDYITSQLKDHTNFQIQHQNFTVKNYIVRGTAQLQAQTNGVVTDYIYLANFTYMVFSAAANFSSFVPLAVIPNLGCQDSDWTSVTTVNTVALVKRGDCTFPEKVKIAEKHGAIGLLLYNDGTAADRFQAVQGIRADRDSKIPAFFLSYYLGMELVNQVTVPGASVSIRMNVDVSDAEDIRNICADTRDGDETKTIVIGAHSDSVPAGSGINDNGSGTVGILVLALNLARLLQKSPSDYPRYPYRIRFCWWGAEEIGLIGSYYHVEQATLTTETRIGERLQDYLLNLNYDMLAGPNYRFGIHDSQQIPSDTPTSARLGTTKITNIFRDWFNQEKLPWSNSSLGGGSDYVPFLAKGLAVGGVNTGAGGVKPSSERDQYTAMLGTGFGGIANAAYDTCYHQQCDRVTNINPFAYEKVVKAAAYAIETLARINNLDTWLYPEGRPKQFTSFNKKQTYSIEANPELY